MSKEHALNSLIAQLFLEPQRIQLIMCHYPIANYPCHVHTHEDLLQLDLLVSLSGTAINGSREVALKETLAMISYPGEQHGYLLNSESKAGHVFSVKIKVDKNCEAVKEKIYPNFTTNVTGKKVLVAQFQKLLRYSLTKELSSPLLLASLAELLCLWPGRSNSDSEQAVIQGSEMDEITMLIQQSLDNPPSIDELADISKLSTRQFMRRFKACFNMSVYQYMTNLRIRRAKEHLSHQHLNITEIAHSLGFKTTTAFSRWFYREVGTRPSLYKEPPMVF
jgi:AraC-like DNA-binding protein